MCDAVALSASCHRRWLVDATSTLALVRRLPPALPCALTPFSSASTPARQPVQTKGGLDLDLDDQRAPPLDLNRPRNRLPVPQLPSGFNSATTSLESTDSAHSLVWHQHHNSSLAGLPTLHITSVLDISLPTGAYAPLHRRI
jgi:hypothetical protein